MEKIIAVKAHQTSTQPNLIGLYPPRKHYKQMLLQTVHIDEQRTINNTPARKNITTAPTRLLAPTAAIANTFRGIHIHWVKAEATHRLSKVLADFLNKRIKLQTKTQNNNFCLMSSFRYWFSLVLVRNFYCDQQHSIKLTAKIIDRQIAYIS